VTYEGITYPSSEHAYQASKTLDYEERIIIASIGRPSDAKRRGRQLKLRDDWESVKLDVMRRIVMNKFLENKDLAELLISTGEEELVEVNTWGDTFWGVCDGKGENWLGKILMSTRETLMVI